MTNSGVYVIRNQVTDAVYVGSSRDIDRRWRAHLSALTRGVSTPRLQRDWCDFGAPTFVVELLEPLPEDAPADSFDNAERVWFERFNEAGRLYNPTPYRHRPDTRAAWIERWKTPPPHVHPCLGDDCDNLNDVPCFDVGPRHEAMYELCGPCLIRYRTEEPDDGREEQD